MNKCFGNVDLFAILLEDVVSGEAELLATPHIYVGGIETNWIVQTCVDMGQLRDNWMQHRTVLGTQAPSSLWSLDDRDLLNMVLTKHFRGESELPPRLASISSDVVAENHLLGTHSEGVYECYVVVARRKDHIRVIGPKRPRCRADVSIPFCDNLTSVCMDYALFASTIDDFLDYVR